MTAHGKWVKSTLYVNTRHYVYFIIHLCRISLYISLLLTSLIHRDFGWKRFESYNHVLFIINISSESKHLIPLHCLRKR